MIYTVSHNVFIAGLAVHMFAGLESIVIVYISE